MRKYWKKTHEEVHRRGENSLFNLSATYNIFFYCLLERKQEKVGKKEENIPVTENKNSDKIF